MATKAEKLAEIAANVSSIENEKLVGEVGNLKTYDIACLVTINAEGNKQLQKQTLYVKAEGSAEEEAWLGNATRKNYEATILEEPAQSKQAYFLQQLLALEAAKGAEVKIDKQQLEVLGIDYLVFEDPEDSKIKITTTLDGTVLIREAI